MDEFFSWFETQYRPIIRSGRESHTLIYKVNIDKFKGEWELLYSRLSPQIGDSSFTIVSAIQLFYAVNRKWKALSERDSTKRTIANKIETTLPYAKELRAINKDFVPCYFNARIPTDEGKPWYDARYIPGLLETESSNN